MTDEEKAAKKAAGRAAKFDRRIAALRKAMREDVAMPPRQFAAIRGLSVAGETNATT